MPASRKNQPSAKRPPKATASTAVATSRGPWRYRVPSPGPDLPWTVAAGNRVIKLNVTIMWRTVDPVVCRLGPPPASAGLRGERRGHPPGPPRVGRPGTSGAFDGAPPKPHTPRSAPSTSACFGVGCTLTTEEWQRSRKHGCASGQTLGRSRSRKAVRSFGEFDPGSGSTLAACMRHARRTDDSGLLESLVADG